jgi:hypothetical protein
MLLPATLGAAGNKRVRHAEVLGPSAGMIPPGKRAPSVHFVLRKSAHTLDIRQHAWLLKVTACKTAQLDGPGKARQSVQCRGDPPKVRWKARPCPATLSLLVVSAECPLAYVHCCSLVIAQCLPSAKHQKPCEKSPIEQAAGSTVDHDRKSTLLQSGLMCQNHACHCLCEACCCTSSVIAVRLCCKPQFLPYTSSSGLSRSCYQHACSAPTTVRTNTLLCCATGASWPGHRVACDVP